MKESITTGWTAISRANTAIDAAEQYADRRGHAARPHLSGPISKTASAWMEYRKYKAHLSDLLGFRDEWTTAYLLDYTRGVMESQEVAMQQLLVTRDVLQATLDTSIIREDKVLLTYCQEALEELSIAIRETVVTGDALLAVEKSFIEPDELPARSKNMESSAPENLHADIASQADPLSRAKSAEELAHDRVNTLGELALHARTIQISQDAIQELVPHARELGLTWREIGEVLGVAGETAYRRWDPEGKRKHSEARRATRSS